MLWNMHVFKSIIVKALALAGVIMLRVDAACGIGDPDLVVTNPTEDAFPLCDQAPATVLVEASDWPGVRRAAGDLAEDVNHVTGRHPEIIDHPGSFAGTNLVIIGTIGKSPTIDGLIRAGKVEAVGIAGRWESFVVQVVAKPRPGIGRALVIAGSDKRGTIYGVYELSEQIGVSPWHFWADVAPRHRERLWVRPGRYVVGPPAVKYRGIFINDEAPALSGWVREQYGEVKGLPGVANYGRGFYTNVFELMLRLRANYLWPAMWNNAFNEDDPENSRLADEYGIVMGTSHQEPMLRAQKEWDRGLGRRWGNWNYNPTNQRPVLENFWRESVRRNQNYENIITLGLRAENDSGLTMGRDLTERIVGVQRRILAEEVNPDLTKVPQMWCLYKEVQDYYAEGLHPPDDVTLLWSDDNWGNLRRLPTPAERRRRGGAGIYYHLDYHGGPRSYQWINTSPIAKIWDQMSLAEEYGADRIWMVNVGHLNKGDELPLEFFLGLAWNPMRWSNEHLDEFTRLWAAREFGPAGAEEIAHIVNDSTRLAGRRKPELLDAGTYSLLDFREFELVVADYAALAGRAQAVAEPLPAASRDAFYEMVEFPLVAGAQLNALYLAAARNAWYARQGRAGASDFAEQARSLFREETNLVDQFNRELAGGKWNHFMDQTYIGYTSWHPPAANNLGAVALKETPAPAAAAMGVAVEAGMETTGGSLALDKFGQGARYVEVFNRGLTPFEYVATADVPWLVLSESQGPVRKERRLEVSADWSRAPAGRSRGEIRFTGAGTNFTVRVRTFNPSTPTLETLRGFVEGDGYVSMEAEHYGRKLEAGANRWIKIPHYGATLSGMRAEGPPEALATPGKDSPRLEYPMYLFSTGEVKVAVMVGATLNFMPGRPLRYAVSFDDQEPRTVMTVPAAFDAHNGNREWEEAVTDNCRRVCSTHTIGQPGYHTLKIWMVDPAVVVQKVVVDTGGVKPSYLGPPESQRHGG
jgi:hypothetical protein